MFKVVVVVIAVLFCSARARLVSAAVVSINTAAQKLVDAEMPAYSLGKDVTTSVKVKCSNSKNLSSVEVKLVDSFEDVGKESFGAVGGEDAEYYSSYGGCIRPGLSKNSSSSSQGYWTQKRTYSKKKGSVKYSVTFNDKNPNFRQRISETIAQSALVSELRRFVALIDNDWDLAWAVAYWLNLHMTFFTHDIW